MLLAVVACIAPTTYGAVANDGKSDRAAIQQAIDAATKTGAEVCLGAGVWNLDRTKRRGSLEITAPTVLRGVGPKTVLRMTGNGLRGAWYGIDIHDATNVVIRDLAIDGLGAFNTEEQTHLVQIGPGSKHIVIGDAQLGPMRTPKQKIGDGIGGDCIRLLGAVGREAEHITVNNVKFVACDRSAVGFQSAVRDVTIAHSTSTGAGDAPIDFEPTDLGAIEDIALVELVIRGSPGWAMTIGGSTTEPARGITIAQCDLEGGIFMLSVADIVLTDNIIRDRATRAEPTIAIMRRGDNVYIGNNRITRTRDSVPGAVIRATHNNGFAPRDITVERNEIYQETASAPILASSVTKLRVHDNLIAYRAADPSVLIVQVEAIAGPVDELEVSDNTVEGAATSLVFVGTREQAIRRVDVRHNTTSARSHLRCDGPVKHFAGITTDGAPDCTGISVRRSPATVSLPLVYPQLVEFLNLIRAGDAALGSVRRQ